MESIKSVVRRTRAFRDLTEVDKTNGTDLCMQANMDYNTVLDKLTYWHNGKNNETNSYAVVRQDTGTCLGVVGEQYNVMQNKALANISINIANMIGGNITHAGLMQSRYYALGSRVCFLGRLGTENINGDEMEKIFLVTNTNDGSRCLMLYLILLRIICANGQIAINKDFHNIIAIRHSSQMNYMLSEATLKLKNANTFYENSTKALRRMAQAELKKDNILGSIGLFTKRLVPPIIVQSEPEKGPQDTPIVVRKRKEISEIYFKQDIEHSVYRMYQAATEYTDYHTTIRAGKRKNTMSASFDNIMHGTGNNMKHRAYNLCMEEVLLNETNKTIKG